MIQCPKKSHNGPLRDAEYDARCADSGTIDPNLQRLITAWPTLNESTKAGIVAMVWAAGG